jgi:hypothetical protein
MFFVTDSAKKKLKRQQLLQFWIFSPVIMLITQKRHGQSKLLIKPHIVSSNKLGEHYTKKIVEIGGLRIIPHFDTYMNTANADEWLLDVASDGSYILIADGKAIEPFWPT